MHNRRTILKNSAALGASLAASLNISNVFARSTIIEGFHQQDWLYKTSFDLRNDLEIAEKNNKILTLLWEQTGCIYCKKMHEIVFQRDNLVNLIKNEFQVIQLDLWGNRQFHDFEGELISESKLARRLFVRGTPTTIFVDDIGDVIFHMPGYADPPIFEAAYRYVHEGAYQGQSFNNWIKTQKLD